MKKVLSMLLVLPLMAATLIACSSDDDITPIEPEQPATKTVTFIASFDPQSRVTYSDVNNELKCRWDESDNEKTVTFISSVDSKEYTFTIGNISADGSTATLTYNNGNGDFPASFNGTATYEVATVDQEQSVNGSLSSNVAGATAHLSDGAKLVTDELTNLTSEGVQNIQFSNVGTTFFRVAIKAPTGGITSGSKLVVRANGQQIGNVTLNFGVDADETLVAYLRATTQADATRMSYTIIRGDDTYSYKSVFSSSHDLEEGQYYYTNLTSKTAYYNKKEVFDALGNASVDVQPIDLDIYLNDDEQMVDESEATKKLLIGDRLLGASTPGGTDCLYFYWGEVAGHRVDENYNLLQNADETGFAYAVGKNEAGNIYNKKKISELYSSGYIRQDTKNVSADGYVLVDSRDAAKQQLGGGWRMMSNKEARAFYKKVTSSTDYEFVNNMVEGCGCVDYYDDVTPVRRLKSLQVKKNGIVVWELPTVGSVENGTLVKAYYHHTMQLSLTGFTWSRDASNVSGNVIQTYCYGAQELYSNETPKHLFGQDDPPVYNKTMIYYGLPILPCMVVEIKK